MSAIYIGGQHLAEVMSEMQNLQGANALSQSIEIKRDMQSSILETPIGTIGNQYQLRKDTEYYGAYVDGA